VVEAKLVNAIARRSSLLDLHQASREQRSGRERSNQNRTKSKFVDRHGFQAYQHFDAWCRESAGRTEFRALWNNRC
jgi:hypothetical protein